MIAALRSRWPWLPIRKRDVLLWPYSGLFLGLSKFSQIPIFTCRVVQLQLLIIFPHFIHRDDSVPFWNRRAMVSWIRSNWKSHADRHRQP